MARSPREEQVTRESKGEKREEGLLFRVVLSNAEPESAQLTEKNVCLITIVHSGGEEDGQKERHELGSHQDPDGHVASQRSPKDLSGIARKESAGGRDPLISGETH